MPAKTSSIWNACDPVIMPRLSRLKSIKHNWLLWIALKKENICYGKDFPVETRKNGKKCKTAWGLFQAGLLTGDACAWHYNVAWMKWCTQTATVDTANVKPSRTPKDTTMPLPLPLGRDAGLGKTFRSCGEGFWIKRWQRCISYS